MCGILAPKTQALLLEGTTGNSNVSGSVTIYTNPTRRLVFWLIFKGAREESVLAVELYLVNLLKSLTIGLRNRKTSLTSGIDTFHSLSTEKPVGLLMVSLTEPTSLSFLLREYFRRIP